MELRDVINENDEVIGQADKEEVRRKGLLSRVAFIILVNSRRELLLQQRAAMKETYPLYWSGAAAGHVDRAAHCEGLPLAREDHGSEQSGPRRGRGSVAASVVPAADVPDDH